MNTTCTSRLSQFWSHLQHELFHFLREGDDLALSPALEKVAIAMTVEAVRPDRSFPRNMKPAKLQGFHRNYKRCR